MFLAHIYRSRDAIPKGAEKLFRQQGTAFIREGRDLDVDNPWDADTWNLTAQGQFSLRHGSAMADAFAKIAGTSVGALKPSAVALPPVKVLIQKRVTNISVGGTEGSSGDGPPS